MEKKFVVDQKLLLNILTTMQPICSRRTALGITSFLLFQVGHKELVIKGTDLEISLQSSCPILESNISENQLFLVSGKRIFEIIKELEGNINFTIDSRQLTVQSEGPAPHKVKLTLNIKDSEEFPPLPERIENIMHLDALIFKNLLDSVSFLVPQNNSNPALNGLLIELSTDGLLMTTTDGHCLAQIHSAQFAFGQNCSWLLPRRAVYELKKLLDLSEDKTIFLGICGNQLVFSGEYFNFFSKLLADPFPHYQAILDKTSFLPASIERVKLIRTLRRSICLLSGQFLATKFNFANNYLSVDIFNKEVGTLSEQLLLNKDLPANIDIRFYAPYLLNGLQVFTDNEIVFYLKNNTSPIIFESNNKDYRLTYLVMPVSPIST